MAAPFDLTPRRRANVAGREDTPMANTKEITKTAPRTPFARRIVEVPGRQTAKRGEPKRLTVGREISLAGEINSCDTLIVEGEVRASLTDCNAMEIAKGGLFKGAAEIATADIAGLFDGDLVVKERLILRGTGRIIGTVRYSNIEIERGGRITGTMELLPDAAETGSKTKTGD